MASTTIHSLVYKIIGDGSQFKTEMSKTNAEIRAGKALTASFVPVMKQHENEIAAITRLYNTGRISLDTFNKGVKAQERAIFATTKVGKAYASTLGVLKSRIAGIAGVLLSGAAIRGIVNQIGELEKLDRAAKRSGADIESLQRLTFAGQFEDVSPQETVGAIEKMMTLIALAESGNKKAEKALGFAHLTAKTLAGKTTEEQFLAVADAIAKIPDANQRLLATEKILGSTGVELSNLLSSGAAGIQEQIDRVNELGQVVSKTDMAEIVKADQAMDEFWVSWRLFTQDLTITLLPILKEIAGYMAQITGRTSKSGEDKNVLGHLAQSAAEERAGEKQALTVNAVRDFEAAKARSLGVPRAVATGVEIDRLAGVDNPAGEILMSTAKFEYEQKQVLAAMKRELESVNIVTKTFNAVMANATAKAIEDDAKAIQQGMLAGIDEKNATVKRKGAFDALEISRMFLLDTGFGKLTRRTNADESRIDARNRRESELENIGKILKDGLKAANDEKNRAEIKSLEKRLEQVQTQLNLINIEQAKDAATKLN